MAQAVNVNFKLDADVKKSQGNLRANTSPLELRRSVDRNLSILDHDLGLHAGIHQAGQLKSLAQLYKIIL